MNYTAILKRSLQITWRHRALWVFGILLALFSGGGSGGGSNYGQLLNYRLERGQYPPGNAPLGLGANWPLIAGLILLLLGIVLTLIILSIMVRLLSEGALIGMVDEVERTALTTVRSGWRTAWARFLRLFGINLTIGIPMTIVLLLLLGIVLAPLLLIPLGSSIHANGLSVMGVILTVFLGLLWLLFVLVLSAAVGLLRELAYRRCVLSGEGVFHSIQDGYLLARRNLRDVGLMWLLLFGIDLGIGVLSIPLVLLGLALVAGPALVGWAIFRSIVAAVAAGVLPFLLFIAVAVFLGGLYAIFRSAAWTLTYRELAAREQVQ